MELLIVGAAVVLVYRTLRLAGGGQSGPHRISPQLAALLEYADRLYAEKKFISAEKAYLRVLKVDHKNLSAYQRLGAVYMALKNYEDAIECFQIAMNLQPSPVGYHNLGVAYFEHHQYPKALAALEKSAALRPVAETFGLLGQVHLKLNQKSKAIMALERAATMKPTLKVLHLLAEVYQEAGQPDRAAAVLEQATSNVTS